MEIITYFLYKDDNGTDKYYENIESFTDKVIDEIRKSTNTHIIDFQKFIVKNKIEDLRQSIEYYIEILLLGVIWEKYINNSLALKKYRKLHWESYLN